MKYAIAAFLFSTLLMGCSGGGSSDSAPDETKDTGDYSAVFIYPENNLLPGEGRIEVSAIGILSCKKGEVSVDTSECQSLLANAPKKTQLAPAGVKSIAVDGAQGGSVSVNLNEGVDFSSLSYIEKASLIDQNLTCSSGRVKYNAECPQVSAFYPIFPQYGKPACAGSVSLEYTLQDTCAARLMDNRLVSVESSNCLSFVGERKTMPSEPGTITEPVSNGSVSYTCGAGQMKKDATPVIQCDQGYVANRLSMGCKRPLPIVATYRRGPFYGGQTSTIKLEPVNGATILFSVNGAVQTVPPRDGNGYITLSIPLDTNVTDHIVSISGELARLEFCADSGSEFSLIKVDSFGGSEFSSASQMFRGCPALTSIPTDQSALDNVTSMFGMFKGASSFNQSLTFNTSKVTQMSSAFEDASFFNQQLNFDTANVTSMQAMFRNASSFNQSLNFVTAKVQTMQEMFKNASSFNSPISFSDTSSTTNMESMFSGATTFNQPLNFNTTNVATMGSMFENASSFNKDLSQWNVDKVLDYVNFSTNSLLIPEYKPLFK